METETWPPEWLKGIAPANQITAIGWRDCLRWAAQEPKIVAQFRAETGETFRPGRRGIEVTIDKATGADRAYLVRFIEWFNTNLWGPEGLPKPTPKRGAPKA